MNLKQRSIFILASMLKSYNSLVSNWNLVKESKGWIYKNSYGFGHSGHHKTPWRAYCVARNSMPTGTFAL